MAFSHGRCCKKCILACSTTPATTYNYTQHHTPPHNNTQQHRNSFFFKDFCHLGPLFGHVGPSWDMRFHSPKLARFPFPCQYRFNINGDFASEVLKKMTLASSWVYVKGLEMAFSHGRSSTNGLWLHLGVILGRSCPHVGLTSPHDNIQSHF